VGVWCGACLDAAAGGSPASGFAGEAGDKAAVAFGGEAAAWVGAPWRRARACGLLARAALVSSMRRSSSRSRSCTHEAATQERRREGWRCDMAKGRRGKRVEYASPKMLASTSAEMRDRRACKPVKEARLIRNRYVSGRPLPLPSLLPHPPSTTTSSSFGWMACPCRSEWALPHPRSVILECLAVPWPRRGGLPGRQQWVLTQVHTGPQNPGVAATPQMCPYMPGLVSLPGDVACALPVFYTAPSIAFVSALVLPNPPPLSLSHTQPPTVPSLTPHGGAVHARGPPCA